MIELDQLVKDAKSMFTFEKSPLVAKPKFKMAEYAEFWIFLFPALSLEATFIIFGHFVKKVSYRIFKDGLTKTKV